MPIYYFYFCAHGWYIVSIFSLASARCICSFISTTFKAIHHFLQYLQHLRLPRHQHYQWLKCDCYKKLRERNLKKVNKKIRFPVFTLRVPILFRIEFVPWWKSIYKFDVSSIIITISNLSVKTTIEANLSYSSVEEQFQQIGQLLNWVGSATLTLESVGCVKLCTGLGTVDEGKSWSLRTVFLITPHIIQLKWWRWWLANQAAAVPWLYF